MTLYQLTTGSGTGVPAWQPTTAYTTGQQVIQAGQIYSAQSSFTSGASFAADGAKWSLGTGGSSAVVAAVAARADTAGYSSEVLARNQVTEVVQRPLFAENIDPASSADQSTVLQAHVTAAAAVNGTLVLPAGAQINCGSTQIIPPLGTGAFHIRGEWGGGGPEANVNGGTKLYWTSTPAGGPHTNGILDVRTVALWSVKNIAFQGPSTFTGQYGGYISGACGINTAKQGLVENCSFQNFSSAIVGGKANGLNGYDHSRYKSLHIAACGYAFNWLAANTAGDQKFIDINSSSYCAGMAIAGNSPGILGSTFQGVDLLGPLPFFRYYTAGMSSAAVFLSNYLVGTSFEAQYHASLYDASYLDGSKLGFMDDNVFDGALYALTTAGDGTPWSKNFTAVSGSGTVLTLTDGSGWAFEPGMTVSDGGSKIPAGTIIAPGGVAGTWPWSTVTLTLSQSVTGTPTNPVTVSQPSLGSFAIGSIQNNRFDGAIGTSGDPLAGLPYYVPGIYFRTNHIQDGRFAQILAYQAPLVSYGLATDTIGNTWGDGGLQGGHGRMATGEACSAGDLLQFKDGFNTVTKCDGTRQPVGVAMLSTAATGNVDYVTRGESGYSWTVNNRNASVAIPAYSLLAIDAANPGGVTVASDLQHAIGKNAGTIIAVSSSGAASEIWCRG